MSAAEAGTGAGARGATDVLERTWVDEVERFDRAVVSWIDTDGYPINAATTYGVRRDPEAVELAPFEAPDGPAEGATVLVTFSHVRPQPGVGYDERRYVNVTGTLRRSGERWLVEPSSVAGWDEQRVPFFEYCERNVARGLDYMRQLSEERGVEIRPRLSRGWKFFSATRVPFLTATLVPVFLGGAIARADGFSAWWLVLLALVGASCIHLGLNVVNDVFDTASGADDSVTPTPFSGGSRVIQHGLVSPGAMRRMAVAFFAAGASIGIALAALRGIEILWLGVAGVFLAIFYTAPPLKLAYRGLGDVAVAAGFGPIMVLGTYFVAAQRFTLEAFYASLPVALLIMLVLYVNQVPDRVGDARAGKRTVAVRLSQAAIVRGYAIFAALAFALIAVGAAAGILTPWALLALAPAALVPRVYRGLRDHYDEPYALMPAMGANIGVHALTGLALVVAYVLAIAI